MNLYIWNNPYKVRFGGSFLAVLADTEEEAQEKARSAIQFSHGYKGEAINASPHAKPDHVMENFNGAIAYDWSE